MNSPNYQILFQKEAKCYIIAAKYCLTENDMQDRPQNNLQTLLAAGSRQDAEAIIGEYKQDDHYLDYLQELIAGYIQADNFKDAKRVLRFARHEIDRNYLLMCIPEALFKHDKESLAFEFYRQTDNAEQSRIIFAEIMANIVIQNKMDKVGGLLSINNLRKEDIIIMVDTISEVHNKDYGNRKNIIKQLAIAVTKKDIAIVLEEMVDANMTIEHISELGNILSVIFNKEHRTLILVSIANKLVSQRDSSLIFNVGTIRLNKEDQTELGKYLTDGYLKSENYQGLYNFLRSKFEINALVHHAKRAVYKLAWKHQMEVIMPILTIPDVGRHLVSVTGEGYAAGNRLKDALVFYAGLKTRTDALVFLGGMIGCLSRMGRITQIIHLLGLAEDIKELSSLYDYIQPELYSAKCFGSVNAAVKTLMGISDVCIRKNIAKDLAALKKSDKFQAAMLLKKAEGRLEESEEADSVEDERKTFHDEAAQTSYGSNGCKPSLFNASQSSQSSEPDQPKSVSFQSGV
jgi:hypothetical protein